MSDPLPLDSIKPDEHGHQSAFGLLFGPDYGGTPASMNYQQHEEFGRIDAPNNGGIGPAGDHDIHNESDGDVVSVVEKILKQDAKFGENNEPGGSNGAVHQTDGNHSLKEVLPGESGEGLPYAPVDWPSPGDVWTWRVGRRVGGGYFHDRFLYPPKRIQMAGKRNFGSRSSVEKFIRSEFPDADVNAFFASFTWKVPARPDPPKEVEAVPFPVESTPPGDNNEKEIEEIYPSGRKKRKMSTPAPTYSETVLEQQEKTPRSTRKKEKRKNIQDLPASPAKPKRTQQSNRKTRHSSRQSLTPTAEKEGGIIVEQPPEIPEDFDNYLNSLEDILAKPVEDAVSQPALTETAFPESQMAKARSKLSSLLEMDFPTLVSSRNVSKLTSLASQLRKDPTMSAEQLVKLKLIEEIPLFSEVFLESRGMIEEVDIFFSALEANKTKVSSLKNEYNELKEKADQLQAQVDSNSLTVKEIDDQIAQLQAWRAELLNAVENNKAAKAEVNSAQKTVASAIPGVVREIQVSNSRIPEWDLKRTNAMKREAEILERFAPLQGFSL